MANSRKSIFIILSFILGIILIELFGYTLFFIKYKSSPYKWGEYSFFRETTVYRGDHPYLPYFPKKIEIKNRIKFNSWGSKGEEPDSPKKRIRIMTFGGSTTYGGGKTVIGGWPGDLQDLLGNSNFEVVNAALNGGTTADSLVNLIMRQIDLDPDYIIIYHGTNDLESSFANNFVSDYSHKRRSIGENRMTFFNKLPRVIA